MPRIVSARKPKNLMYTLKRLFSYMGRHSFSLIAVALLVVISVVCNLAGTYMISPVIDALVDGGGRQALVEGVLFTAVIYIIGVLAALGYSQIMAYASQKVVYDIRIDLFDHMQSLPLKYFDTHQHGDVMSYYTNDIDAMRQMIAQSLPQLFLTLLMLISVGCIMLWYSVPLTCVVVGGAVVMALLAKALAGRSAKNFLRTQRAVAAVEGHVEEIMNGEKVVKVFCHEPQVEEAFDRLNDEYEAAARAANSYANTLMPILMNMGNLLYVVVAVASGVFLVLGTPNPSLSGLPLTIAVAVPFLNMTKQFANQIGQISNQVNSVVMGLAGAERIFELLDEPVEQDGGYVDLVACTVAPDGTVTECDRRAGNWAGQWAWRHPHSADGSVTYTPLAGDVRLFDVDFGYEPGHTVLHDVSLYAKPGQKVAFVGATGAGKTTITNLINRFYDIEDGKIRYDGININKIKKPALRRSLGVVLQDVNLFTGTVMDNIRYGRLDASDEECVAAARLAGADDFIRRLPDGYDTMLTDNGTNLSQGQRQLISIARAAVADPPVMVLDEATSSIDTRTEAIVQRGMDALMTGRTTFVIAHRLSTVRNSDVIIVLDHGRVIERGTHEELIAKKGTYYQLYTGAFELE